ncbi:MAG: response regulator [Hyphomicrobiales bacterium]|nr:response regulator [Hyphomicrobiales bacterium]MBV9907124.1 response regulator [Hyphomicrobiales bacterium]
MTRKNTDNSDLRTLVFAPIGRDAVAVAEILRQDNRAVVVCADLVQLVTEIEAGAGAVFVAEEALFGKDTTEVTSWIERQPPWSDLPFIVLTSHVEEPRVVAWRQSLTKALRNVALLERPVQPITLAAAIRAALRARAHQYEVRALISDRERAAQELEALVNDRTRALLEANAELRTQMAERARAEESLRQAQKLEAIGQLTGGVAHDFNNLLMVISGGLEMLRGKPASARQERLMQGMQQAVQRGAALTKQLLAFSRQQPLKPEPVDVARQVEGMQELLNRSLHGDVQVDFQFASSLWAVEVDAGELELAILNLVLNARDAMPNGGTITVSAVNCLDLNSDGLRGDYVRLSVSDSGTGMTTDVLTRVFEPFFTTKEIGKGSGLGLAQVHGFVMQSRGQVRIDSAPGAGTTIDLYLPRSHKRAEDQHAVTVAPIEQPRHRSAGCVLLVEDDAEVAELVSEMLDQLGFGVIRVASANAALGALSNGRPIDLVFSDIMMPGGMNGIQLAREIRARRSGLPILLTSGYSESAREEADREGISILPKPYRLDELCAALKKSMCRTQYSDGRAV